MNATGGAALLCAELLAWSSGGCSGKSQGQPRQMTDAASDQPATTDADIEANPDQSQAGACTTATAVHFRKVTLHRDFTCEGATAADINHDGVMDAVAGPDWYAGPEFNQRRSIWPRTLFDPKGYSDCFFEFPYDFNGDGWMDVLVVGFPGTGAAWYQNPVATNGDWIGHDVVAAVDGESPAFTDITHDGVPELVFISGGRLGWAGPARTPAPDGAWTFHPLSQDRGYVTFTHGLGLGDLNGDGLLDVIEATGTFIQPTSLDSDPVWARQDQTFASGGAQMYAADLDGDGDADVVTTMQAHGYGLAWYERLRFTGTPAFAEHVIVPNSAPADDAAVILYQPHALAVADVDRDGLSDLITGERFWGHVPQGTPDFAAPARIYWFHRGQGPSGPCFVPHLIDADSGVGTQLSTVDVNADGRMDIVVSNKKGAFLFLQDGDL